MLNFYSASVRSANTERAVNECLEVLSKDNTNLSKDCRIIIVNATLGHPLEKIALFIKERLPDTLVLGASCSGVTGKEGVGESMNEIAVMAVCGERGDCDAHSVNNIFASNSYEKGLELARNLKLKTDDPVAVYLLCSGIDIASDLVLQAFEEVFGENIIIGGGTSSDNMRGLVNYQYLGDILAEHGAWAVAFSDKTLNAITRATHGFVAGGEPMTVTKSEGNKIIELNGKPAWEEYTAKIGIKGNSPSEILAMGALAEELSTELAEEYGNTHILRGIGRSGGHNEKGHIIYPTTIKEGVKFWLTERNEDLIFSEQEKSLEFLKNKTDGRRTVAIFQSDCLVRGRLLFNKIMKDEIILMMQNALSSEGAVPPWIGIYGFGEYARLGGKNMYHNYTTALLVLYR